MKVVHVSFYYDEKLISEEELLEQHYTVTGWAEALRRRGADVIVMNRFSRESALQKNNVHYHFIKDHLGGTFRSWRLPMKFFRKIVQQDADVIHLHHLSLPVQTFLLRLMLRRKTAIVIQHHGGVAPGKIKRFFYNLLNSVADGFFFTTAEQGKEWLMDPTSKKVLPVMEGATFFNFQNRGTAGAVSYYDRETAREKTGMTGHPVFLWVGRLDENKDPLAVLAGLEMLFGKYKDARLYMIYSDNKLLDEVREKIKHAEPLKNRVQLLGKISHEKIELYYNSADYFVLGSHYEGSGYALSEALRCGCVPIITGIPSFRMMTNNGQLGALWEPGNKDSFAAAAYAALKKPLPEEARACMNYFKEHLSFDAIAGTAMQHYRQLIISRTQKTGRIS